jgi:glycosyltransferase involved in cell wall biosynthesis
MKLINDTVIIIPAYNEGKVIADVLEDVLKRFKYVIVVDDGSSDNTKKEAEKTGAIVISQLNLGQGGALQTGIEYSLNLPVDYFVTFDADGQHDLHDVIKMRKIIKESEVDIVIGSRFLDQEADGMTRAKKALLKCGVWFTNVTSGLKLTDTHNGLRLFNRHVAETVDLQESGYQHASEFTDKIATNHYKYNEMSVHIIYTDYSRAKGQSLLNAVNIGFDVLLNKVIKK